MPPLFCVAGKSLPSLTLLSPPLLLPPPHSRCFLQPHLLVRASSASGPQKKSSFLPPLSLFCRRGRSTRLMTKSSSIRERERDNSSSSSFTLTKTPPSPGSASASASPCACFSSSSSSSSRLLFIYPHTPLLFILASC